MPGRKTRDVLARLKTETQILSVSLSELLGACAARGLWGCVKGTPSSRWPLVLCPQFGICHKAPVLLMASVPPNSQPESWRPAFLLLYVVAHGVFLGVLWFWALPPADGSPGDPRLGQAVVGWGRRGPQDHGRSRGGSSAGVCGMSALFTATSAAFRVATLNTFCCLIGANRCSLFKAEFLWLLGSSNVSSILFKNPVSFIMTRLRIFFALFSTGDLNIFLPTNIKRDLFFFFSHPENSGVLKL